VIVVVITFCPIKSIFVLTVIKAIAALVGTQNTIAMMKMIWKKKHDKVCKQQCDRTDIITTTGDK
jgi:hypothetical protein